MRFTIIGEPIPQGSMKAFMPPNAKFPIITSDNPRLKAWRKLVSQIVGIEMRNSDYILVSKPTPIRMIADFYFEKPPSVKRLDHVTRPDLDKCARSLLDSMTGIVYEDDAQVTEIQVRKMYGSPARVEVEIQEADFPPGTVVAQPIKDSELAF